MQYINTVKYSFILICMLYPSISQTNALASPAHTDIPIPNNIRAPELTTPEPLQCFQINEVEIKDPSDLLSRGDLSKIKETYENKCLNENDINNLIRYITNSCIRGGYITSRVSPPDSQDLKLGKVVLEVNEGYIEEVMYKNKKVDNRSHVLPIYNNKILNLKDIEQSVDQFSRLKSKKAKFKIAPGKKPGSSVVEIDSEQSKKWYVTTGLDNSGSKYKGVTQSYTTITLEDMLRSNEIYSFGSRSSIGGIKERYSRSYSGLVSVPFGYHNVTFSTSYGNSRNYIHTKKQIFPNKGSVMNKRLSVDSVLHRDGKSKTMSSIGVAHDNYSNYIADYRIEISSYKLDKYFFGFSHQRRLKSSIFVSGITFTQGVN